MRQLRRGGSGSSAAGPKPAAEGWAEASQPRDESICDARSACASATVMSYWPATTPLVEAEGRPAATPVLQRAIAAFGSREVSAQEMLRWGWLATRAANLVWDYDSCLEIGTRAVQLARETGALEALAVADNACGQAAAFGGDFTSAALLITEVEAVKEATGTRIAPTLRSRSRESAGRRPGPPARGPPSSTPIGRDPFS